MHSKHILFIVLFLLSSSIFAQLKDNGPVYVKDQDDNLSKSGFGYSAEAKMVGGSYTGDFYLLITITRPAPKTIFYRVKFEFQNDDEMVQGKIDEGDRISTQPLSAPYKKASNMEVVEIYYRE